MVRQLTGKWNVLMLSDLSKSHSIDTDTQYMVGVDVDKDGSWNWGGFAHIKSLVVYCLEAHFLNILDPSFRKKNK